MSSTGQLTGVNCVNSNGTFRFTVAITAAAGATGTFNLAINMTAGPAGACGLTLTPASLVDSTPVNAAYANSIGASGGTGGPYTFVVISGALPTGLSLDPVSGAISGTPSVVGTFAFNVKATDSLGNSGYQTSYITVTAGAGAVTVGPPTLPGGTNGVFYSVPIIPTGGTGPYSCVVSSGTLPPGLQLTGNVVTGTPTTVGSYNFTITCTDSLSASSSRNYLLQIDPGAVLTLAPAALPNGTNGTLYSQTLSATGGTGSGYVFTLDAGALPGGLTLDGSTGVIAGTPSAAGTFTFTAKVVDSAGNFQTRAYSITIAPGAVLTLAPASLPNGTNGTLYSQTLSATGGTGSGYVFTVDAGALPGGLTLDGSTGEIAGTPSAAGTFTFTAKVVDSAGNFQTRAYTITIAPGSVLRLGPQALASPLQGIVYTAQVVATGGTGSGYTYAVSSGQLPTGLSLNPATGAITGKTLSTGTFTFTVRAEDSGRNWGVVTYTFIIAERPDPTRDPEVIALADGQFRTMHRFTEGQSSNAMRHLESVHGGLRCNISNRLTISAALPDFVQPQAATNSSNPSEAQPDSSAAATKTCEQSKPALAFWTAGSVSRDHDNLDQFSSDAVTVGLDYQINKRAIVGFAVGFGWGDAELGNNGSNLTATGKTAMAYVSYGLLQNVFLDAVAGKSWVDLSGVRHVSLDQSAAGFKRKGEAKFGSIALTLERQLGAVLLSGQTRYSYAEADLGRYQEASTSPYTLTYGKSSQSVSLLTMGGRAETMFEFDGLKLVPSGRIELRHRVSGSYEQEIAYSDLLGRKYLLSRPEVKNDFLTATVGVRMILKAAEIELEYGTSGTAFDSLSGSQLRVMLRKTF